MNLISRKDLRALFVISVVSLFIAAPLFAGGFFSEKPSSVEVAVRESSPLGAQGGSIIPASCPSYSHFPGECGGTGCTQSVIECSEWGCYSTTIEVGCPPAPVCPEGTTGAWPDCVPIPPVVSDVCPNLTGSQSSVPSGYVINNIGECVQQNNGGGTCPEGTTGTPPNCVGGGASDQCANIAEVQVTVPDGYARDSSGDCFPDSCPNLAGIQSSIPAGMVLSSGGNCVQSGESCSLDVTPTLVNKGGPVQITWSCSSSTTSAGSGFSTGGAPTGGTTVRPNETTNYSLVCGNSSCVAGPRTVQVNEASIGISANPTRVRQGNTSTITWNAAGVTSCLVQGPGVSRQSLGGSDQSSALQNQSIFTITCQSVAGPLSASVTVNVTPAFCEPSNPDCPVIDEP